MSRKIKKCLKSQQLFQIKIIQHLNALFIRHTHTQIKKKKKKTLKTSAVFAYLYGLLHLHTNF